MQWPGTELERSPQFDDVRQHVIERRTTLSARDYVGHLSTVSAYLQLPADRRRLASEHILAVLPDPVEVTADITLHLARRISQHLRRGHPVKVNARPRTVEGGSTGRER